RPSRIQQGQAQKNGATPRELGAPVHETSFCWGLFLFALGHDPDVPEADVMMVPLELDWAGGVVFLRSAAGGVGDVGVVVSQLAVPVDGDAGVLDLLAVV